MSRVRHACSTSFKLGEGLNWNNATDTLWGVDIDSCILWRWNLIDLIPKIWILPQRIGWIISTSDPNILLLGLQDGFALADTQNPTQFNWVQKLLLNGATMRLNDAKADISGAVWSGSMNFNDESKPDGLFYRLSSCRGLEVVDTDYKVPNGPAINSQNTLMLHSDSVRRIIYAFDLNSTAGQISNKRIWKIFSDEEGYPDGMCFDSEDSVWVAHWGVGLVSRFSIDGNLIERFELPVKNITNVCFGGKNLNRLFVSTASIGADKEPLAGDLFEIVSPGVCGLPSLPYRL